MNFEISPTGIDLQAIATVYEYQPCTTLDKKVDLEIDWQSFQQNTDNILQSIACSVAAYNPEEVSRTIIINAKTRLRLEIGKTTTTREGKNTVYLRFNLRQGPFQEIASFGIEQGANHWEISHRKVEGKYRSQGISSEIIKMIEFFVSSYGITTQSSQSICMEVGQLYVMDHVLKRGYTVDEQYKDAFENTIELLTAGDQRFTFAKPVQPTFVEKQAKNFSLDEIQEDTDWYVFKKSAWGEEGLWHWEDFRNKEKCARFPFIKEVPYNMTNFDVLARRKAVTEITHTSP